MVKMTKDERAEKVSVYSVEVSWPVEPAMVTVGGRRNSARVNFVAEQGEIPWLVEVLGKDGLSVDSIQRAEAFASINDAADEFFNLKIVAAVQQPSKLTDPAEPDETEEASNLAARSTQPGESK
jgi:hypothetical protein